MIKELVEVFRTEHGCVYQCDSKNCFFVEFQNTITEFKPLSFFYLKTQLDKIDLHKMVDDPSSASDIEILAPVCTDRFYILTLTDVLNFKELLSGSKAMMELNSILNERLKMVFA